MIMPLLARLRLHWRATGLLTVLALLPGVLLAAAHLMLAGREVTVAVRAQVRTTAEVTSVFLQQQVAGLAELVSSVRDTRADPCSTQITSSRTA